MHLVAIPFRFTLTFSLLRSSLNPLTLYSMKSLRRRLSRSFSSNSTNNVNSSIQSKKKEYKDEKKRVASELVTALRDPTVVVMADWLKARGTLKRWNRYYFVLKPGLLLVYKTDKTHKQSHWVGTILLNVCELIERPSKKDGFCFKLFHPLDQNIWATRGPFGESHGAVTLHVLPTTYLICRAPSNQAGRCWMDALELALRCSGLLMRTMHKLEAPKDLEQSPSTSEMLEAAVQIDIEEVSMDGEDATPINISETEAERHFTGLDDRSQDEIALSDAEEENEPEQKESPWMKSEVETFGPLGGDSQTGDVGEENKSLLWALLKQVRPGMDLSKVVLPTFILEPRSFLEKLSDYYFHADLLHEASLEDDPHMRMVKVVRFYLSGFYKKPKGLKKPYNPILGETFRCCWEHPDGSTTFYVAEQVSHHPPISSLFVSNRKAGFDVSATILAKSKYYGNSVSAMMLGKIRIRLLNRGETYTVGLPFANCKGIMIGTMTLELGGQLKPFLGGSMNVMNGQIKLGKETITEIDGHWDGLISYKNVKDGSKATLWEATTETFGRRLPRKEIPLESQGDWESKKLWIKVSEAIANDDQYKATEEKTVLEADQRRRAKSGIAHETKFFRHNQRDTYDYVHAE
ncbi:obr-3 [Pristionchus pacificus]|uniref:Obr-3 n=1 Tax=Pristionchus pacificus TaxID=54126 RepID=A0A2A6BJL3_PRIPA|nr:obr-3 [Pristionchus pacificus]|eukprot:PDM66092.1 obr-3 [Pristionchus pacificus]